MFSALRIWDTTRLDKYIDRIAFSGMFVLCILMFVSLLYSENLMMVFLFMFMAHLIFEIKYGWNRGGNMKYIDETPQGFENRTGRKYIDNTPQHLTCWKALKIYYSIKTVRK